MLANLIEQTDFDAVMVGRPIDADGQPRAFTPASGGAKTRGPAVAAGVCNSGRRVRNRSPTMPTSTTHRHRDS
jgi:hypothetical protein